MGLQTINMKLKPKLLTCSAQARLSIILGMDVMHWALILVEQFKDKHGFLALYACKLSNSIIPMGNRQFPYTPDEAQSALSQD